MNYIKIINWFWDEVPSWDGYKGSYQTLFFAVVDSINRNMWNKTRIDYDRLINKCHFNKRTYLEARQWLMEKGLLTVEVGKNGYQMAVFSIGVEVQICTATSTAIGTGTDTTTGTTEGTTEGTATAPLQAPNSKPLNKKTTKPKTEKPLNISFDDFWNLYDNKKDCEKCKGLWKKLTDAERQKAMEHTPKYISSLNDLTYQKNPATYLYNKSFNDEIKPLVKKVPGSFAHVNGKVFANDESKYDKPF